MTGSELVRKEPCPKCGSTNNLARYSDGHAYCFGMGCGHYEPGEGNHERGHRRVAEGLITGTVKPITKRGITVETAQKFGYMIGEYSDKAVHVAPYRNQDGDIAGQKLRFADKSFIVLGSIKNCQLFGQHLWPTSGKRVVVTEGEIDAMSVSQAQGNKWPVVSIPAGAASARKALQANLQWLLGFDEVVLWFDSDEPGQDAVKECLPLFPPGRAKYVVGDLKDANDYLMAERGQDMVTLIWNAKEFRPEGIKRLSDLREDILSSVSMGRPWPWPTMTQMTYGRHDGQLILFGAGTGIGKTDLFTQTMAFIMEEERLPVAAFLLEQPVKETGKRVAGKVAGKRFHVPDAGWTQDELDTTLDRLIEADNLFLFDHFGHMDWNTIADTIRYLAHAHGVKDFFIDHLTALADPEKEKETIEITMKSMASLAQELGVILYVISHLSTPDGTPHEEGGQVSVRQFKGSRSIGFWSHVMFGLERNQQHPNAERRRITTVRCLKERLAGSTGSLMYLLYDPQTGLLSECDPPSDDDEKDAESYGFRGDATPKDGIPF